MKQNNLLIGKKEIKYFHMMTSEELIYYLLHKIDFIKDRLKNDKNVIGKRYKN